MQSPHLLYSTLAILFNEQGVHVLAQSYQSTRLRFGERTRTCDGLGSVCVTGGAVLISCAAMQDTNTRESLEGFLACA